jgi:hypothetical protein
LVENNFDDNRTFLPLPTRRETTPTMTSHSTPVRIPLPPGGPDLSLTTSPSQSKGQATFNALVKQIGESRRELAQWQAVVDAYDQKIAGNLMPLLRTYRTLQATMVRSLDRALSVHQLGKSDRRAVQEVICQVAQHLLADSGDAALKEIYNRHSPIVYDTAQTAHIGPDVADPAEGIPPENAQPEPAGPQDAKAPGGQNHKKTAKKIAREAAFKAEAERTTLSIREVYRKLVSALHPDREPDALERARKTALMQRVNQAYDKNDLLLLLELQIELQHIDAHAMANLPKERLKHFNKLLKAQLNGLEQEILRMEMPFRTQFRMPSSSRLTPGQVMPRLSQEIAELKRDIRALEQEIRLPTNPAAFKEWIRALRREARS